MLASLTVNIWPLPNDRLTIAKDGSVAVLTCADAVDALCHSDLLLSPTNDSLAAFGQCCHLSSDARM
jgi:hypothetical protein